MNTVPFRAQILESGPTPLFNWPLQSSYPVDSGLSTASLSWLTGGETKEREQERTKVHVRYKPSVQISAFGVILALTAISHNHSRARKASFMSKVCFKECLRGSLYSLIK